MCRPFGLAGESWGLGQSLHVKLHSSVPMVHEHDGLVGGLPGQAGCQGDQAAGQLHLGVWLLLLMQKGVAHHLRARQHSSLVKLEPASWSMS